MVIILKTTSKRLLIAFAIDIYKFIGERNNINIFRTVDLLFSISHNMSCWLMPSDDDNMAHIYRILWFIVIVPRTHVQNDAS